MIAAGVDVGGLRKGFHAVALEGSVVLGTHSSRNTSEIADWCRQAGATVVGVDAPCRWSVDQSPRDAERALMAQRIFCFSTPTEIRARSHPKDFYGWMITATGHAAT